MTLVFPYITTSPITDKINDNDHLKVIVGTRTRIEAYILCRGSRLSDSIPCDDVVFDPKCHMMSRH